MTQHFDVVIAGGGLNGPTLALALAQAGLRVAIVDPQPLRARSGAGFDGRAYSLAIASVRVLDALGLWDGLRGDSQPIHQIKASQGQPGEGAGPFLLHFDSAELGQGPVGHMLEDRFLHRALVRAMEGAVTTLPGLSVTDQADGPAGIDVTLSDGRHLTARLLVGADGRGSGVATRAGIRRQGRDYRQTALVAAVDHALPHEGIAHQYFMATGPLAILPLPGNRSNVVWSETTANAAAIAALDDQGFLDVLRPRFGSFLGDISLAGPRFAYPLSLSLAQDYIAPRVALIGDAAHGVHPVAGQGLNLGLRDVAALAQTIVEAARRGEDIGSPLVLARYQGWRRPDATALALGMDGVNSLFATDNAMVSALRGLGMGLIGSSAGLRRGFMRQAAGLAVDPMPRLLAGQPL